jgi:hypothetical protein
MLAKVALKRILGPKRGTKTKLLTKVYNEQLHSSSSADVIKMMNSRGVRWGGHLECVYSINTCGDMKAEEVFDQSSDCYVVRKACAVWSYVIFYLFRVTRHYVF